MYVAYFNVFVLSVTLLNTEISNAELDLDNYSISRCDRTTATIDGSIGVLIGVCSDISLAFTCYLYNTVFVSFTGNENKFLILVMFTYLQTLLLGPMRNVCVL